MSEPTIDKAPALTDEARLRRWHLVLGSEADSACSKLSGVPAEMDQALVAWSGRRVLCA